jgi:hypothetical protein
MVEEEEEEIEWGIERVKWREKSGFVMLSVECVCVCVDEEMNENLFLSIQLCYPYFWSHSPRPLTT